MPPPERELPEEKPPPDELLDDERELPNPVCVALRLDCWELRYELDELDELLLDELDERNELDDDELFDEPDDVPRTAVEELLLFDDELTVEPRRVDVEPPPVTEVPFDDDELPSAELALNELLRLVDVDEPRKLPAELWLLFDDEPTLTPLLTFVSLTL